MAIIHRYRLLSLIIYVLLDVDFQIYSCSLRGFTQENESVTLFGQAEGERNETNKVRHAIVSGNGMVDDVWKDDREAVVKPLPSAEKSTPPR